MRVCAASLCRLSLDITDEWENHMPKLKKILYATDLSESAKSALSWAITLAEQADATVSVIHIIPDVIEEMSASMGYDLSAHYDLAQLSGLNKEGQGKAKDSIKERIQDVCSDMKADFPGCSLDFKEVIVKPGHPVKEIINTAVTGGFDMVIMGTHGHSLLDDILLGSVARGVVHKCPVPVLTIRLPAA
jgi:nucleotide-binding universal stress UspA family protein